MKVKIVKEVKRSDGLWRFACGDVFFKYAKALLYVLLVLGVWVPQLNLNLRTILGTCEPWPWQQNNHDQNCDVRTVTHHCNNSFAFSSQYMEGTLIHFCPFSTLWTNLWSTQVTHTVKVYNQSLHCQCYFTTLPFGRELQTRFSRQI